MKDKIYEAYTKLRNLYFEKNNYGGFQVVIKMHPRAFCEFQSEFLYVYSDKECNCYHIEMFGYNTPILIDRELPEEIEFQIQERKDYERMETEKFFTNLNKMFEERKYRQLDREDK